MREEKPSLEAISTWSAVRLLAMGVALGLWLCAKRALQWVWRKPVASRVRDTPPVCLVDHNLGQHSYVKLKGTKIHFLEAGSKEKPLVLLLHGFPDCWLGWRHQIPELAKYFRVIAVDLKGFGDSDKPSWRGNYRPEKLLKELRKFIAAVGVTSCTVVGHDLGALLGWMLVHTEPNAVDRLVAISSPHPNLRWGSLGDGAEFGSSWVQLAQLPFLPEMDMMRDDLQVIERCYPHLDPRTDLTEAYKYVFSSRDDWTGALNYFRNLPYFRVGEDVPSILVPTLLITGNKDPMCRLESVVQSSDWSENSLVKIVEGAGHFPHQECPEVVNKYLIAFLVGRKQGLAQADKSPTKGFLGHMFGAVSSTVKYGGSVIDNVQKRTNGAVGAL